MRNREMLSKCTASIVIMGCHRRCCEFHRLADAVSRQGRGEDTARWEVIDFPGLEDNDDAKEAEDAENEEES